MHHPGCQWKTPPQPTSQVLYTKPKQKEKRGEFHLDTVLVRLGSPNEMSLMGWCRDAALWFEQNDSLWEIYFNSNIIIMHMYIYIYM